MRIAILFVLALAACNDDKTQSCAISNEQASSCQEFKTSESNAAFFCRAFSGTLSNGRTCPTTNVLGTCDVKSKTPETFIYIYSGGEVTTVDQAKAVCAQDEGEFTPGE